MSEPLPTNRRREIGSASARSLLLTILGEFVHPRHATVWTTTLLEALVSVGVEEKSARQALTRTASEGLLTSTRHGRRVLWELTPAGRRPARGGHPPDLRLHAAAPPVGRPLAGARASRSRRPSGSCGTGCAPGSTWLGLGSPTPGLWVSPDAGKADAVHAVVRELGLSDRAFAWSGDATGIGDEARLLADSWDLAEVEDRYLAFLAAFESRSARSPAEAFLAQVQMVQEWRRFPFLDPDLPGELLDHDWPGPRAAAAFHDAARRLAPAGAGRVGPDGPGRGTARPGLTRTRRSPYSGARLPRQCARDAPRPRRRA